MNVLLIAFFGELFSLFLLSRLLTQYLSGIINILTRSNKISVYVLAMLFFPGTLVHEVAHYLMARVLFVHAEHMVLMPKIEGNHVRLGSVDIQKTDPIRRSLIGVAPFLFGTVIIIGTLFYRFSSFAPHALWVSMLVSYVVFEVGNTMFSSKKDLEGTIELLIVIASIGVILYILGFRLPTMHLEAALSLNMTNFLQQADIYLLIPLILDVLIVGVLWILRTPLRLSY